MNVSTTLKQLAVKGAIAMALVFHNGGAAEAYAPHVVSTKKPVYSIFSIPVRDAVGTLDIGNALSSVAVIDTRRPTRSVASSRSVPIGVSRIATCPRFSDRLVCWLQGRAMLIADVNTHAVTYSIVARSMNERMYKLVGIDDTPPRVVVEVGDMRDNGGVRTRLLRALKIDTSNTYLLGERDIGTISYRYNPPWTHQGDTLFVFHADTPVLDAFGLDLQPIPHPLVSLVKDYDGLRRVREFAVHPHLPLAVLIDGSRDRNQKGTLMHIARWAGAEPRISTVALSAPSAENTQHSDVSFSPDGHWLVYRSESDTPRTSTLLAVPLDPENPLFVGKPISLGRSHGMTLASSSWTTEPVRFVVCAGSSLYSWNLDELRR